MMESMSEDKIEKSPDPADPQGAPAKKTVSASRTRRVLAAVAVGAVVAAIATIAISGGLNKDDSSSVSVSGGGPAATGSARDDAFTAAAAGDCLNWTPATESGGDRTDMSKVQCGSEHRFEVAGPLDLSVFPGAEFGPGSRYPGALRFAELRDEHCTPIVMSYLGSKFDPKGKFSVGLMFPSESGWASGERALRCGLQFSTTTGELQPFVGRVADQDQSNVWDVGTCIGINQNLPTDPVDCAKPHAYEVISVIDLGTQFPGAMPSVEDQDRYLEGVCTQASNEYLGSADALRDKTLTLFWDNISLESWLAGSRRVNCSIGKEVETGGFAAITGSAKGDILINGAAPVPPPAAPEGRSLPTPLPGAAPPS
ncbi:septum formation family protein [Rhodococcus qingshengii]|uniref:septum formation family protein n=2 Tax=Rhodococcus TaxID=1827 RepID=UPI000F61C36E|nr:hypothetical protein EHW12_00930 [Rhodococcus sp. NJ-530]